MDEKVKELIRLGRDAYQKKEYAKAENYLTQVIEKFDKKTLEQTQFPIVQLIRETKQPKHLNIKIFSSEQEFDAYDQQVKESEEQTNSGVYGGMDEADSESIG